MDSSLTTAPQTVILLGASNLARAFPVVLGSLRQGLADPLAISVAMGHGRSFGQWSRLLGRALPGINQSGLWPHLFAQRRDDGPAPLAALTDVGNDLMYGTSAATLLDWLEFALQQLDALRARTVMLSLPMASLARLSPLRFAVARQCLFPGHRGDWPALYEQIAQLDAGMRALSQRHGAAWMNAGDDWYGLDPIHIRRSLAGQVWPALFSHWPGWRSPHSTIRPGLREALALRLLRPAERVWFGVRQLTPQPALSQPDRQVFLF